MTSPQWWVSVGHITDNGLFTPPHVPQPRHEWEPTTLSPPKGYAPLYLCTKCGVVRNQHTLASICPG